jgi:hypothetical protein
VCRLGLGHKLRIVSGPEEIGALAAIIGRQTLDLNLYAAFLQGTLAGLLPPEYVTVERSRSLLRRGQSIIAVSVRLGEHRFVLRRDVASGPRASIAHEVGGIVLGTQAVPIVEWVDRLAAALGELARDNAEAAAVLARLTSYEI